MNKPPILCDKCDSNFSCLLDYDGENCRKTRSVEPTNADRLNAMTVEEKAEWFEENATGCPPSLECYGPSANPSRQFCIKCWLDWLNKTASDTYWLDWLKGVNNGD